MDAQKKRMQAFYDAVSATYTRREQGVRHVFHNSLEFKPVEELALRGKSVLDLGTGTGRFPLFLQSRGVGLVVGGDISYRILRVAAERSSGLANVAFVQLDGECLPFREETFDLITVFGLFEYVADLRPYLAEIHRVSRPGSYLLFTCRNSEAFFRPKHKNYSLAYHSGTAIKQTLAETGYELLKHETIYHVDGRWVWGLTKVLTPFGVQSWFVHLILALNVAMKDSERFGRRGKTHLVFGIRR